VGIFTGLAGAQGLLKATVQYAKVESSASATRVSPGGAVVLRVDITPNPTVHIYAEGAKDVAPVALTLTPNTLVSTPPIKYPKSERVPDPASFAPVPAYAHAFRIEVPATISSSAKAGDVLTLGGVLTYQACDERMCYPVSSAPVTWQLSVGASAAGK
jgi:hypothetical protein